MYYLIWFDNNAKHSATERIAGGIQAYQERFRVVPAQVLVNAADMATVEGVNVEAAPNVQPWNYWIGPVDGVWL